MEIIAIKNKLPGISGLMAQFTHTTNGLREIAHSLLVQENGTLTRWEKELIAMYASSLNKCEFCTKSHGYVAGTHYGMGFIWSVLGKGIHALTKRNCGTDEYEKFIDIFRIVEMVHSCNKPSERMEECKEDLIKYYGLTETDIHDIVLITAAFNMYNRYVNALAQNIPVKESEYEEMAKMIVEHGYKR